MCLETGKGTSPPPSLAPEDAPRDGPQTQRPNHAVSGSGMQPTRRKMAWPHAASLARNSKPLAKCGTDAMALAVMDRSIVSRNLGDCLTVVDDSDPGRIGRRACRGPRDTALPAGWLRERTCPAGSTPAARAADRRHRDGVRGRTNAKGVPSSSASCPAEDLSGGLPLRHVAAIIRPCRINVADEVGHLPFGAAYRDVLPTDRRLPGEWHALSGTVTVHLVLTRDAAQQAGTSVAPSVR